MKGTFGLPFTKKYLKNIYQVADEQKTLAVLAHITNSRNLQYWGANFNAV